MLSASHTVPVQPPYPASPAATRRELTEPPATAAAAGQAESAAARCSYPLVEPSQRTTGQERLGDSAASCFTPSSSSAAIRVMGKGGGGEARISS